jgi:drug/metabolite transporter (DMT)-like permease
MLNLILASLLWAFSFGLIKGRMGGLDPADVAAGRLLLAAMAFSPFLLKHRLRLGEMGRTMLLGALQFGVMYWLYIASYAYLPAWLVALFTVFTPLYVVLISDAVARKVRRRNVVAALVAVAGALLVVAWGLPQGAAWRGVFLLQGANLCFAVGQLFYPQLKKKVGASDVIMVGWMYWGAFLVTGCWVLLSGGVALEAWDLPAGLTLLYLGLLPTAVGFYWWNRGAARVSPGWLAVANNLKIPLAVVVSWLVFGEDAEKGRAVLGLLVVVGSLFIADRRNIGKN